jgi:hypothetical protein
VYQWTIKRSKASVKMGKADSGYDVTKMRHNAKVMVSATAYPHCPRRLERGKDWCSASKRGRGLLSGLGEN